MRSYKLYSILLLFIVVSCKEESSFAPDSFNPTEVEFIEVTVQDFIEESLSRTTIEINNSGAVFTWAANDTIGIFPDKGDQVYFPMIEGEGTRSATFTGGGWALKTSNTYYAYYPFSKENYVKEDIVEKLPVSYKGQKQRGNNSTSHLSKYDYIVSPSNKAIEGKLNFNFQHVGALLKLDITLPEAGIYTKLSLRCNNEPLILQGTINLKDENPIIQEVISIHHIDMELSEIETTEDNQAITIYMMIAPMKNENQLSILMEDEEGIQYEGVFKEVTSLNAGYIYQKSTETVKSGRKVIVQQAGTLSDYIDANEKSNISSLSIEGEINGTDIKYIREMAGRRYNGQQIAGRLQILDLSKASIVKGGENYYDSPSGITENDKIGDYFFSNCQSLVSVILPESVTEIKEYAFSECRSLASVTISDNVTNIGSAAFYKSSGLVSIHIPNSVTEIDSSAFQGCSSLTSVSIPENVTAIKYGTFMACDNLFSISIPNSVTRIENLAFTSCPKLSSINIPNSVTEIGDGAFINCSNLTSIIIPNSVKEINSGTFSGCINLSSIIIPNSVKKIGSSAFRSCSSLPSITLPSGIKKIEETTFDNCRSLSFIDIPNSVTSIDISAFRGCSSLISIILPASITEIGYGAFNCNNLMEIHSNNIVPPTLNHNYDTFNSIILEKAILYVPKGALEAYKSAIGWKDFMNIMEE